jgi:hypothetical protein
MPPEEAGSTAVPRFRARKLYSKNPIKNCIDLLSKCLHLWRRYKITSVHIISGRPRAWWMAATTDRRPLVAAAPAAAPPAVLPDTVSRSLPCASASAPEPRVAQYHTTRPLAPPYSLHTVLRKVESYNGTHARLARESHLGEPGGSWSRELGAVNENGRAARRFPVGSGVGAAAAPPRSRWSTASALVCAGPAPGLRWGRSRGGTRARDRQGGAGGRAPAVQSRRRSARRAARRLSLWSRRRCPRRERRPQHKGKIHRVDPDFGSTSTASTRDSQPNRWVNLKIVGQPCEFQVTDVCDACEGRAPAAAVCTVEHDTVLEPRGVRVASRLRCQRRARGDERARELVWQRWRTGGDIHGQAPKRRGQCTACFCCVC